MSRAIRLGRAARCAPRVVRVAATGLALAVGCASAKRAGETAAYQLNPVGSTDVMVTRVSQHGDYLAADVKGPQEEMTFLAPATAACAQVLRPEARVEYRKSGIFGRFVGGETACDPVGVLSLAEWRDREPRARAGVVPRSSARYTLLQQDDHYLFLRGRFALAARVGIPASYDLVAVLPNEPACRAVAERTEATLEYRPAGPSAFQILSGDTPCPVRGFAQPLEHPAPSAR